MGIFNRGLERFIQAVSNSEPTHIDVKAEHHDSGTEYIVTEYFAVYTGHYKDRKPIIENKKYGGTNSKPEEMDLILDQDIQRLRDLGLDVRKLNSFQDESTKTSD